ncbi:RNA polymerase, sigma 54 subunit, RpoN/SigL [Paenibacillus sophorae]|uniref:RNA polymerase factor sigma-54 n=1 Tax=Paenibacillus sophorae TaxID=1333845 RepID=A0A1H8U563_9BACL|nr:RNA polymerase factor sigma-54 [Paenibacillus sophorae]QWU17955.1 RNA polymerase factor sigma-54 [Paenibacillus sophorae]SEO98432.1 RNA polymerase, sigma 54 subunit, RpoN/SigL [Paenibacillus sophorae]
MIQFGLKQEQTLKLAMTPELRQAIQMLQYSSVELLSYLREQANDNPVIDLQETDLTIGIGSEPSAAQKDWKDYDDNRSGDGYAHSSTTQAFDLLAAMANPADTLYEHLKRQLGLVRGLTESEYRRALYLIGNLDEKGYLELDMKSDARLSGASPDEAEKMLALIQRFDPAGVAARSLEECLLLQLRRDGSGEGPIFRVVERHLGDLAANRLQKIADALGTGIQEVQRIADSIRRLNPRPGASFAGQERQSVIADITVEKIGGEYTVFVNETGAPRVSINAYYNRLLREQPNRDEACQYIHDRMAAASWLIKSLEQRRTTLLRVSRAVVEMQRDFFEHGIHGLKPLTQKEIAETTGLHESTISRAVGNKYMQTPRGLFELKYFFTSSLASADGDAASSESVKLRIKVMIDGEDKRKPLSDQAITELLTQEGLELSRRTVAKYREEMRILSSAKRKRF